MDFDLNFDRNEYAPGDSVNMNITSINIDSNETIFASVIVTDESSFVEVP